MALLLAGVASACTVTRPRHYLPPSDFSRWFPETLIISDPSNARIEVDGVYVGTTPLSLVVPRPYRTRWAGEFNGGTRVAWVGGVRIVAIPHDPELRVQQRLIPPNEPAPSRLAFEMRGQARGPVRPSGELPGEPSDGEQSP